MCTLCIIKYEGVVNTVDDTFCVQYLESVNWNFYPEVFTAFLLLPLLKYLHVCDLGHNCVLRFLAAGQTVTDQASLLCVVFCPQRPQCFYTTMYPNNHNVILVCTSFVVEHSLIHCLKEMMYSKQSWNYPVMLVGFWVLDCFSNMVIVFFKSLL